MINILLATPITATTSNASSYVTAAFTPAANAVLIVFAAVDGYANFLAASGGATYTQIDATGFNTTDGVYAYFCYTGASPASQTVTVTTNGANATGCCIIVLQILGADLSLTSPVVQAANASATSANPTATFASPVGRNSGLAMTCGIPRNAPGAQAPVGWITTGENGHLVPAAGVAGAYRNGGEVGTSTFTFLAASSAWGALAVEIRPAINYTAQPEQQTAAPGATATFAATAGGAVSKQWQSAPITTLYGRVPGTWADIVGETGASYTTGALAAADNGTWIRLKAVNGSDITYSEAVRLFITGNPVSGKGRVGGQLSALSGWAFPHSSDRSSRAPLLRKRLSPENARGLNVGDAVWRDWFGFSAGGIPGQVFQSWVVRGVAR